MRFLVLMGFVALACYAVTPHIEDAPAPHDYYRQMTAGPACRHPVSLIRSTFEAVRPYREVGMLSATCYPGAPKVCEQRLLERACEMGADALILRHPEPGANPPGGSRQSLITMNGRAVRFTQD